jgi:hypothetical protein
MAETELQIAVSCYLLEIPGVEFRIGTLGRTGSVHWQKLQIQPDEKMKIKMAV